MESEIREQSDLLRQNWPSYDETLHSMFRNKKFDCIVIAARGSSDHAALYGRYLLQLALEIPVILATPSVLTRYGKHIRYTNALGIGISQSGAAPDVAEVLEDMRAQGHATLGITNTSGSRLTAVAENALLLRVDREQAVAATKTYTASLLALYALARALGGKLECPDLPEASWNDVSQSKAESDVNALLHSRQLFALARGIRFCSAYESALKLMECALLPCLAYSLADFQHGPKALADERSAAIIFGNKPSEWAGLPGHILQPPVRAGVDEAIMPVWDAFYLQWLALLTARKKALDPDRPEGLSKITETL